MYLIEGNKTTVVYDRSTEMLILFAKLNFSFCYIKSQKNKASSTKNFVMLLAVIKNFIFYCQKIIALIQNNFIRFVKDK